MNVGVVKLRKTWNWRLLRPYLGPAFLVSVGYMDPGNWATDLEGGSRFGYALLWAVFASSMMAILLQILSAKLGIATGKGLAANCRQHYGKRTSLLLWLTAEIAMMATDLAEFIGAALGLGLLFGWGMLEATLVTGLDVFLFLGLMRFGVRKVEALIVALVAVIGWAYVVELFLAKPDLGQILFHTFVPTFDPKTLFLVVGIVGATVMPHNLYLHSSHILTRTRINGNTSPKRKLFRFAVFDTVLALNAAWFVNAAILIMAAAAFHERGLLVVSIEQAHQTLIPLFGSFAGLVFAVALLASGLSSSTTGTLAGQYVMEEFLELKFPVWLRRAVTRALTMIPALIALSYGVNPVKLLVWSQVLLSFQLPFAVVPLVRFTQNRRLMGELVNTRATTVLGWTVTALIIVLNALLLGLGFFSG